MRDSSGAVPDFASLHPGYSAAENQARPFTHSAMIEAAR